jgi:hypothetical protein
MFAEAKKLYCRCLTGIHANDSYFMFGLAKAEFGLNNFAETKAILDNLIELNPDFKNAVSSLVSIFQRMKPLLCRYRKNLKFFKYYNVN